MGFFPYNKPRYAFAIMMEHGPRKNLMGATSVMRNMFDWMHVHTPEYILDEEALSQQGAE
jgi:cell division protein FtsI/penicillin-binding protein 2